MPTKTYRCENCSFVFDNIQRFDEPNPTVCPRCRHENMLVRVYKPVGVVFKGSGFYATDHKSASRVTSPNGSKPSENGQVASESSDSAKKTDSKPEAKKEKSATSSD